MVGILKILKSFFHGRLGSHFLVHEEKMDQREIRENLEEHGFCVLREFDTTNIGRWKEGMPCPSGKVNYTHIRPLIESSIDTLNKVTGWNSVYAKYRASAGCTVDSSNASDAAAFHRDIQVHETTPPPLFTLVMYYDEADLAILPKSHRKLDMGLIEYAKYPSQTIHFNEGDAILFNSSMMHRGMFKTIGESRRCVQIFDIAPTPELADKWYPKMLHLQHEGTDYSHSVSRLAYIPIISRCAHFFQEVVQGKKKHYTLPDGITIVSKEGWRKRLPEEGEYDNKWHDGNLYVIRNAPATNDDLNRSLRQYMHRRYFIEMGSVLLWIVAIFLIIRYVK